MLRCSASAAAVAIAGAAAAVAALWTVATFVDLLLCACVSIIQCVD